MDNLFNSGEKINLDPESLKRYFLTHLDKIYCAKKHLTLRLPIVKSFARLTDLKDVISNTITEMTHQINRLEEIYTALNVKYSSDTCKGLKYLIDDVFAQIEAEDNNYKLQDMSIIYYLQCIESLEMASFQALQIAAVKFNNKLISNLLKDSFNEAKAERELLLLLSGRYITS